MLIKLRNFPAFKGLATSERPASTGERKSDQTLAWVLLKWLSLLSTVLFSPVLFCFYDADDVNRPRHYGATEHSLGILYLLTKEAFGAVNEVRGAEECQECGRAACNLCNLYPSPKVFLHATSAITSLITRWHNNIGNMWLRKRKKKGLDSLFFTIAK